MRRLIIPLFVFAAAGLVVSVAGMLRVMNRADAERKLAVVVQPDPASIGLTVPEFSLTDQDGRPRTQDVFDGHVTVLDFFFTRCPFICPMMTLTMEDVAKELKGTPVQFVSISVDPSRDPPARLQEYATDKEIDLSRWTFMTGEYATIERIAMGSLGFAIGQDKDPNKVIPLADGSTMQNVIHPSKLILVGPDRRVLGFYEYSDPEACAALVAKARAVAKANQK
jgi:protein SCO1/2